MTARSRPGPCIPAVLACIGALATAMALSIVLARPTPATAQEGGVPPADDCDGHHSCGRPCENCHADDRGSRVRAALAEQEAAALLGQLMARRTGAVWFVGLVEYLPAEGSAPGALPMVNGRRISVTREVAQVLRVGSLVEVRGRVAPDGSVRPDLLTACRGGTGCSAPLAGDVERQHALETSELPPVDRGRVVFLRAGCGACHAVSGLSTGTTAPSLNRLRDDARRILDSQAYAKSKGKAGTPEDFIRESIFDPRAFVLPDCPAGPCELFLKPDNYRDVIAPDDVEVLVAFLLTLAE